MLSSNVNSAYCTLIYVQHVRIMGMESTGHTSWSHKYIVKHSESSQSVSSNGPLNKRNKHRRHHRPNLHIIYFMTASYIHRFTALGFITMCESRLWFIITVQFMGKLWRHLVSYFSSCKGVGSVLENAWEHPSSYSITCVDETLYGLLLTDFEGKQLFTVAHS